MIDGALSALARGGLVEQRPPADMLSPASLLSERGAVLPLDHARLLSLTNGLTVYGGYFRLFGIGPGATRDMRRWNAWTCWRHAWSEDGRADGWWFFGETAWGDQYAYATSDDPLAADRPCTGSTSAISSPSRSPTASLISCVASWLETRSIPATR